MHWITAKVKLFATFLLMLRGVGNFEVLYIVIIVFTGVTPLVTSLSYEDEVARRSDSRRRSVNCVL